MPEASVHLDRDLGSGEHDVRSAGQSLVVDAEAQAPAVDLPSDSQLRTGPGSA